MRQQKKIIRLIWGFFLLCFLLITQELVFNRLYRTATLESSAGCNAHISKTATSSDVCEDIKSAADLAFSYATDTHIFTYFVVFVGFYLLGSRLFETEKRLKELEDRTNV